MGRTQTLPLLVLFVACGNIVPAAQDASTDASHSPVDSSPAADVTPCTGCAYCSGFTPTKPRGANVMLNACDQGQLASFVAACLSSTTGSQSACDAWKTDAGPCGACLMTGPLQCTSSTCWINFGGCVDIVTGNVSQEFSLGGPGSCGDAVTGQFACEDFACSYPGWNITCSPSACIKDADEHLCMPYVTTCTSSFDATSLGQCFYPQTDAQFVAFSNLFCGTGS